MTPAGLRGLGWTSTMGQIMPVFLRSPKEWSCHISQRGLAKEQAERSSQELVSCLGRRTSMQGIHRDRLGHKVLCLSILWSNADADGSACVASWVYKADMHSPAFLPGKKSVQSEHGRMNCKQTTWCLSQGGVNLMDSIYTWARYSVYLLHVIEVIHLVDWIVISGFLRLPQ